jgi:hypothetical protein
VSSGAVTKSLPSPFTPSGMVPNLANVGVIAQARRVQGQCHEAVEADPAATGLNGPLQQFVQGAR